MDRETIKGKVEQGTGSAKQAVGHATGDRELEAQGMNDKDEGKVREGFGTMRDKARQGAGAAGEKADLLGNRIRDAADRADDRTDDSQTKR